MRIKAALIIIIIAMIITFASFGSSMALTNRSLTGMMGQDITLALNIANDLISTRIRLYESDAHTVAERLMKTGSREELVEAMCEQLAEYDSFMAMTVFDRDGVVAKLGDSPTSVLWLNSSKYLKAAFDGRTVISTTRYSVITGKLVMHICTPLGEGLVLSITIPGTVFSDDLSGHKLWNSGHIWMLDEEGVVIAHADPALVTARTGYIDAISQATPQETVDFFTSALVTDRGLGTYFYHGEEYQCAYARVTASELGWRIGLSVALSESPVARVRSMLVLLAVIFFIISTAVALLTSGYIAKPYFRIFEQNKQLEELNGITRSQTEEIRQAMVETLRLQTELETALRETQAACQEKSIFLAKMSHEMRTPLNAVIGLSELILSSDQSFGETGEKLEKIHTSGLTLLGIVNDLLDISKIESGKFELHPVEYDTPSLINDIISLNTIRIGEKPIHFTLSIGEDFPARLCGDDLRVVQIFSNLLSNAFKYTHKGTVEWVVTCQRDGDDVWLLSDVIDTGIGIKQEDIGKLFREYTQVDTQSNRKAEGTGLGLSITERLVSLMDGAITVKSEYGKGSTFSVRLRQAFVSDTPIGPVTASNLISGRYLAVKRIGRANLKHRDLSFACVLVVDDMPTNLDVARGVLAPYGLRVECATSGAQAIEMIRAGQPKFDAVFMDHMMPGMDGIEATHVIRHDIGTTYAANVPIIALTANAIAGNEAMFLENGFQAFISKPIDISRLDSVLHKWVRDKGAGGGDCGCDGGDADSSDADCRDADCNGAGDDSEADSSDADCNCDNNAFPTIEGLDTAAGLARFGNSEELYVKILQSYAMNARALLESIAECPGPDDLSKYAISVHGMKGSSYSVGATEAGEFSEKMESMANDGDMANLSLEHPGYIRFIGTQLSSVEAAIEQYEAQHKKTPKTAPEPELLQSLREACAAYDAARVDEIMSRIAGFKYERGAELVQWLRGQVEAMNYDEIQQHLSSHIITGKD